MAAVRQPLGLLPIQAAHKAGRMTVVLDMDETLIHSEFTNCSAEERERQELFGGKPACNTFISLWGGIALFVRPGLTEFLARLAAKFEVVVFTAGEKAYADTILDMVDPNRYIDHRLYRESTTELHGFQFVKDLNSLGRDMRQVIMVDNSLMSMIATPDNCVLIKDFLTDRTDCHLPFLCQILIDFVGLDDVRPTLREAFSIRQAIEQQIHTSFAQQHQQQQHHILKQQHALQKQRQSAHQLTHQDSQHSRRKVPPNAWADSLQHLFATQHQAFSLLLDENDNKEDSQSISTSKSHPSSSSSCSPISRSKSLLSSHNSNSANSEFSKSWEGPSAPDSQTHLEMLSDNDSMSDDNMEYGNLQFENLPDMRITELDDDEESCEEDSQATSLTCSD